MKGWIFYHEGITKIKPEDYEIQRFLEEAKAQEIDLQLLNPSQIELIVPGGDPKNILIDGQPAPLPDFILPRMGSGTTYFDLAVIRHLEKLGVYSLNSSQSIDTVKDKLYTHQILAAHNIPVPKTILAKFPIDVEIVDQYLGFPVVLKPISGTQGHGIYLSEKKEKFNDIMQLISAAGGKPHIILQQYVMKSRGHDLRVLVVGGRVVGCFERRAAKGSFKANISSGGTAHPYKLTPEIEWLAVETCRILGLEISGVDLLFGDGHFKVCEANSSPAFQGAESCLPHLNMPKEIFNFIRIHFGIHKK